MLTTGEGAVPCRITSDIPMTVEHATQENALDLEMRPANLDHVFHSQAYRSLIIDMFFVISRRPLVCGDVIRRADPRTRSERSLSEMS